MLYVQNICLCCLRFMAIQEEMKTQNDTIYDRLVIARLKKKGLLTPVKMVWTCAAEISLGT